MKLATLTTHPIQYYAPVFKLLSVSDRLEIKVFYSRGKQEKETYDLGFGKKISWDIPLLEGYDYTFLENTAKDPGSHHFRGVVNPTLIDEVEGWGAEAILVFGWSYQSHLQAMRYFKGKIPVYFRGDSHLLDEQPGIKQKLRRFFLRWVYRHIDKAFYVGTNNKAYYLRHGLKENQLVFAPHAIDNGRFADPDGRYEAEAQRWRKELKVRNDQKIILFCGKFENKKDPLLLLQVAKQFTGREDLVFLFAGNGPLEHTMKEQASHMNNVRFLDFQNQSRMPVAYRLGDVYVLPSQGPGETWGLAVNEAMASGRPVVVSNKVGCEADLVKDGVNGKVFPARSLQSLSNSLDELLSSDLQKIGSNSQAMIRPWNFETIFAKIEKTVAK